MYTDTAENWKRVSSAQQIVVKEQGFGMNQYFAQAVLYHFQCNCHHQFTMPIRMERAGQPAAESNFDAYTEDKISI